MSKKSQRESFEKQIRISRDLIAMYNKILKEATEKGDEKGVKSAKESIENENKTIKDYYQQIDDLG